MLYAKSQPDPKKPSDKVLLQIGDVSDILGTHSDKKSRKPKRNDPHNYSSDQPENQTLEQMRDLFLLIKSSLFEEDDSIYEDYWRRVFQQYDPI